jgi:small subunit ribosomal protein S17
MRSKKGIITSNKEEGTLTVTVHTYKAHPLYKKRFRQSTKYRVDNPKRENFEMGAEVTIYETRPISKTKRWTVVAPENTNSTK